MLQELCGLFETGFTRLERVELTHVAAVYASVQQLFAIAVYESAQEMEGQWTLAADEVAYRIQGRLSGEYDPLRWDIYLLLLVTDTDVSSELRKKIENNQRYFRKLVLTREDRPFAGRLPFRLNVRGREQALMFEEDQFLAELRGCLPEDVAKRLGDDFFAGGAVDDGQVLARLKERFQVGGERDADSGDGD